MNKNTHKNASFISAQGSNKNQAEEEFGMTELRKNFGTALGNNAGIKVLRPGVMGTPKKHQTKDLFSFLVDDQPVEAVCEQFDFATRQLLYRAHSGDEKAAQLLIAEVGSSLVNLRALIEKQPAMMQSIAEKMPRWPVMLSPNPKDLLRAKKRLTELKVGARTPLLTQLEGKSDPEDFWSKLAKEAYEVCDFNRHVVPFFVNWTKGGQVKTKSARCWDKTMKTTFYHMPNGRDVIAITDWQFQCAQLPPEVNEQNFEDWWNVITGCVLEYWRNQPAKYEDALKAIGKMELAEPKRRKLAMQRLVRGFKSLVGMQRAKLPARV